MLFIILRRQKNKTHKLNEQILLLKRRNHEKMLVLLVVVMAALSAHAQEMYLGGGISLWRNTDLDKTSFPLRLM